MVSRDAGKLMKQIEKWGDGAPVVFGVYKHFPSVRSEGINYYHAATKERK